MIPLNFYRDDSYVYFNNPNGITKKMTIAEFEAIMSGESELPAYTSSDADKVLAVNSDGTGLEWAEGGGGGVSYFDAVVDYVEQTVECDVTKADIDGMINSGVLPVIRFNAPEGGAAIYEPLDSANGDNTGVVYSFKRYVTFSASGEPIVISISGYIMIMLVRYEENNEIVEQWVLDYLTTN